MIALQSMRAFNQSRITIMEEALVRLHEGAPNINDHSAGRQTVWTLVTIEEGLEAAYRSLRIVEQEIAKKERGAAGA
jgi:hypothetical protein